jgi:hypothetical protein
MLNWCTEKGAVHRHSRNLVWRPVAATALQSGQGDGSCLTAWCRTSSLYEKQWTTPLTFVWLYMRRTGVKGTDSETRFRED